MSAHSQLTTNNFQKNPEAYQGITKQIMGKYVKTTNYGFILNYNGQQMPILYDYAHNPPKYGEILVYGTFQNDGTIQALEVHNYDYNYIIYLISFIAFLFIVQLFFKEWKLTKKGFIPRRESKNA